MSHYTFLRKRGIKYKLYITLTTKFSFLLVQERLSENKVRNSSETSRKSCKSPDRRVAEEIHRKGRNQELFLRYSNQDTTEIGCEHNNCPFFYRFLELS